MMAWFLTESKPCLWSTTAEALPLRSWRCTPEIVEVFYTRFQNGLHSGLLGSGSVVVFPATCSWYFLPAVPGISCHLFLVFPATCSWYFLPAVPGISCQLYSVAGKEFNLHRWWHHSGVFWSPRSLSVWILIYPCSLCKYNLTHIWSVDEVCSSTIKPHASLVFQPHTTSLVCWWGLFLQSPVSNHTQVQSVSPTSKPTQVQSVDERDQSLHSPTSYTSIVCGWDQSPQSPTPYKSGAWTREISLSSLPPRPQVLRADEISLPNLQPHTPAVFRSDGFSGRSSACLLVLLQTRQNGESSFPGKGRKQSCVSLYMCVCVCVCVCVTLAFL